ncbi:hypothetical protein AMTR_s00275p00015500 [Amborella trichopoda]|uniref:Uncharacterized protein n=1 Tax=Amborella trichopoda TaxID=13333 RepID=W1P8S2_AMBTC|nr:hypothetical protein AMTR_s00275p00015500 [Amborella trichopoda]
MKQVQCPAHIRIQHEVQTKKRISGFDMRYRRSSFNATHLLIRPFPPGGGGNNAMSLKVPGCWEGGNNAMALEVTGWWKGGNNAMALKVPGWWKGGTNAKALEVRGL